ncbi:MAG TPA: hypothetical protein VNC78_02090 [Actinomycetota bacterium]|nr:hypothetical protein [Actinomycetota bacterium]
MRDIDREVTDLLGRMAQEAGEPRQIPQSVIRRSSMRRRGVIAGTALLVVGVLYGGASLAKLPWAPGDKVRDQAVGMTPDPQDSSGSHSEEPPPEHAHGELIAQGVYEGRRWWLTASGEGNICTELSTQNEGDPGSGGRTCGELDAERHPIGLGIGRGGLFPHATGHVPQEVERLELLTGTGTISPIELYDAPPGFGFQVKLFAIVPFPPEAEELVAYDGAGEVVGRQHIFSPEDGPEIQRIQEPFVVAEGRYEGISYVFRGFLERQLFQDGESWIYPCTRLFLGPTFGGGGTCHIALARGYALNYSQDYFPDPQLIAIQVATQDHVDRVVVELDSGVRYEAEMFVHEETSFRFFLAFVEAGASGVVGELVAYRGSQIVERAPLCTGASDGGTCGP